MKKEDKDMGVEEIINFPSPSTISITNREISGSGEVISEKNISVSGSTVHESFTYVILTKFCNDTKTPKEFKEKYKELLKNFGDLIK